jgi:precorrin-6B methylase 2
VVDEHLWAVVMSGSRESGGFPADCESRLAEFGALVATATTPTTSSPIGEELEHCRCCNEARLSRKSVPSGAVKSMPSWACALSVVIASSRS